MGMRILSGGGSFNYPNDPIPTKFTIQSCEQKGDCVVARINYHNCTNYKGDKILVFKGMTVKELKDMKAIDPHFIENDTRLKARFIPTPLGLKYALRFAEMIGETNV